MVSEKKVYEKWDDLSDDFGYKHDKGNQLVVKKTQNDGIEIDPIEVLPHLRKNLPVPVTLINTRDCFAYDLKYTEEVLNLGENR